MSSADPLGAGRIEPRELEEEMRSSFLDYAMSVIVARALPDVRDGLKPVHRRVLFAMHETGLQPNRPRVKCSAVIGEVMKSFHPHGDASIYDTLVRMAQKFSLRYPLVDPQGNFGNVDGYSAAAHRYTEARLSAIATELLRDIDSDTVDFGPNYDGSRREPLVLPSRFPNLLVNGSSGIAVGMATNMPPHHLGEVVDAIVAMIDEPTIDVDRLAQHVKGPDFPTGAIILGREGIRESYRSGRGRIVMRARAHIEELRGGRTAVVVTELPYGVRKGGDEGVIRKIAELVKDNVFTEISGIKDLSDKTGMRIQIELKREAVPQVVLNKLYKRTPLQSTFGYNAVALVDGVPRTLSLLELIRHYLDHQREVVTRRLKYELRNAVRRAHVLEGYLIALDRIEEIIALIRGSDSTESARTGLMEQFGLSEIQAQAILDMRLARLTGLARKEIEAEFSDLQERISELRATLSDEAKIDAVIREELLEIKQIYGRADDRRTEIAVGEDSLEIEDMIAEEDMVIAITRSGYINPGPAGRARSTRRSGRARSRWHACRSRRGIVPGRISGHGLDQAAPLGGLQLTPGARCERAVAQRADARAHQPGHGCPTASNMRRTWRLRPSWIVIRTTPGLGVRHLGRGGDAVVELDPVAQLPQRSGRHAAPASPRRGTPCRRRATGGRCGWPARRRWSAAAGPRCRRRAGRPGRPAGRPGRGRSPSGGRACPCSSSPRRAAC